MIVGVVVAYLTTRALSKAVEDRRNHGRPNPLHRVPDASVGASV